MKRTSYLAPLNLLTVEIEVDSTRRMKTTSDCLLFKLETVKQA